MAGRFQLRRGNTAQNDAFIGAEGEVTYDTQAKGIRVHDGVTPGGNALFGVVEFQVPTAQNNYTWYRKYADGWVEQGGSLEYTSGSDTSVVFPITMANTRYTAFVQPWNSGSYPIVIKNKTTTGFDLTGNVGKDGWQVSGMAA